MNLRWNGSLRRFEAEFSSDFQGDLAAVKAAGFKTDGAPTWIWWTYKAGPLTKLRTLRPGLLTISPEAREQYTSLVALEAKNAEVKAQLDEHKKNLKKKDKIKKKESNLVETTVSRYDVENDCWIDPPRTPVPDNPSPPPRAPEPDGLKCFICGVPVYFYEKLDPPTCLWCEKTVLDINTI